MQVLRKVGVRRRNRAEIKNIVIFGETGVGKSSLINLIADARIAETSSNAVGCTLDYKRYVLTLDGQRFAIWDTAGLDEGSQGTVPAQAAEAYLKQLLRDLAKESSIDLLIYCVRGTRVRSALLANYHLFYSAICRKKVPIAIVITGLENQEGNMNTWWLQNRNHFSVLRMHFDNYACVTTLQSPTENAILRERRAMSRTDLLRMIASTCRTERWMPAESRWINTVFSDIQGMLSPRDKQDVRAATVIMCDISRSASSSPAAVKRSVTFQNPITLSRLTRPTFRTPVLMAQSQKAQSKLPFEDSFKSTEERVFRVFQVAPKPRAPFDWDGGTKKDIIVNRGADLLVFCTKKDVEQNDVKSQWEYFNFTYGGDLSPRIVVIVGATGLHSATDWWTDAVGGTVMTSGVSIAYWPEELDTITDVETARMHLQNLVNTCCIDCSDVHFSGDKQVFKKRFTPRLPHKARTMPLWTKLLSASSRVTDVAPGVEQDALTRWGVWKHASGEAHDKQLGLVDQPSSSNQVCL